MAVVLDLDDDVVALLEGVERDGADRRLAHRLALGARLDPVIDGVAHHVHERIAELLDDELVDLGLGAGDDQVDELVGVAADLADDARELVEDLPERHHAHLEDALLHRAEVPLEGALEALHVGRQLALDVLGAEPLHEARQRGADDGQLAHDVHQAVELVDVDAHRLGHRADGAHVERQLAAEQVAPGPGVDGVRRHGRGRGAGEGGGSRLGSEETGAAFARRARRGPAAGAAGDLLDLDAAPVERAGEHGEQRRRGHEDVELDRVGVGARAGGQVGDDLAVRLGDGLQLVERLVDGRELELHPQAVEPHPLRDVGAEAVLLVLGEDGEEAGVEIVRPQRRGPRRPARALVEAADELVHLGHRLVLALLLGLEDAAVELDRAEEQIEHRGRELDAAEAEVIEQLLELVRERRHAVGAEEPGEPLERVHRAEDVVDQPRVDAPAADPLVEAEQIAAQPLDDLLGLGEELVARAVADLGHQTPPSRGGALGLAGRGLEPPSCARRSRSCRSRAGTEVVPGLRERRVLRHWPTVPRAAPA